jgi:ribulose 1,5-bisphosphate synthetase/thiazole synthase
MQFNAKLALAACASGQVLAQYASGSMNINGTVFQSEDIIMRDVCILGGGSTGTYSAVRLSQDLGKSVVVVEQNGKFNSLMPSRAPDSLPS